MHKLSKIIISLFGIGFSRFAPGTIGSLTTIVLFYFIINHISSLVLIFIFVLVFFISLILIRIYSLKSRIHDSPEIVIDEFLGILLVLIFYDYLKFANDFIMFILIFLLFRFFDILKIYPANWIDKNIKNSLGIILDDLVAALYCIIILLILNVFL